MWAICVAGRIIERLVRAIPAGVFNINWDMCETLSQNGTLPTLKMICCVDVVIPR